MLIKVCGEMMLWCICISHNDWWLSIHMCWKKCCQWTMWAHPTLGGCICKLGPIPARLCAPMSYLYTGHGKPSRKHNSSSTDEYCSSSVPVRQISLTVTQWHSIVFKFNIYGYSCNGVQLSDLKRGKKEYIYRTIFISVN